MTTAVLVPITPTEGTGLREDELIAELAVELRANVEQELTEGGSPARLIRLVMPDGSRQVLKLLVDMPSAVDGHDLESFRVKLRQLDTIHADAPKLAAVYTKKLREFHGADWSAYTMPYYPSEDLASCLRGRNPDETRFFDRLDLCLRALARHGWGLGSTPVPSGQISEIHANRLDRRFWLLEKHLPAEYTSGERIVINGRSCRHPLKIARQLMRQPSLTRRLDPTHLHFPAHGDLNTRNVLITGTDQQRRPTFRIIDPRGSLHYWDVAYDLSKLLFSLTVWDAGLREGFDITSQSRHGSSRPSVTVAHRGGLYPSYRSAVDKLVGFFEGHDEIARLVQIDPGWKSRVLLGHAFHLLAEAACRLSDVKKRAGEATSVDLSPIELATGHYLFGALFLEDAVSRLARYGEIDVPSHLGLLPREEECQ